MFDFILFLIIGGVAQRMTAQDYSLTHAFLIIATFVVIDVLVSLIERDVPTVASILKGLPTIVVENGRVLSGRLRRALTEDDVLQAARRLHGLETMNEIKFAIFEASGEISIIPRHNVAARDPRVAAPAE